MRFTFSVKLYEHIFDEGNRTIETISGEIEAPEKNAVPKLVLPQVNARIKLLEKQTGLTICHDSLSVWFKPEESEAVAMSAEQIIALIQQRLTEAENNANMADTQLCQARTQKQRDDAYALVSKASTQATLLQSLLDEIDGKEVCPLWQQ